MLKLDELSLFLHDEAATVSLGQKLGKALSAGGVVFLTGTLGAGKTTLTRGILNSFGHSGAVKSPTYTLVEPYEFTQQVVYHFDLYRLADPEELEYMGIREYFDGTALCIVEWPDKGEGFVPVPDLQLALSPSNNGRNVSVTSFTALGQAVVKDLNKKD